jgi:hypothetical protein
MHTNLMRQEVHSRWCAFARLPLRMWGLCVIRKSCAFARLPLRMWGLRVIRKSGLTLCLRPISLCKANSLQPTAMQANPTSLLAPCDIRALQAQRDKLQPRAIKALMNNGLTTQLIDLCTQKVRWLSWDVTTTSLPVELASPVPLPCVNVACERSECTILEMESRTPRTWLPPFPLAFNKDTKTNQFDCIIHLANDITSARMDIVTSSPTTILHLTPSI